MPQHSPRQDASDDHTHLQHITLAKKRTRIRLWGCIAGENPHPYRHYGNRVTTPRTRPARDAPVRCATDGGTDTPPTTLAPPALPLASPARQPKEEPCNPSKPSSPLSPSPPNPAISSPPRSNVSLAVAASMRRPHVTRHAQNFYAPHAPAPITSARTRPPPPATAARRDGPGVSGTPARPGPGPGAPTTDPAAVPPPHSARLPVRRLPAVIAFVLALAWQADRRRLLLLLADAVLATAGTGMALAALRAGLHQAAGRPSGLSGLLVPVLVLGALGVATTALGAARTVTSALLTLSMQRTVMHQVVTASAAAPLRCFDDPAFHDRLARITSTATTQLPAMTTRLLQLLSLTGGLLMAGGTLLLTGWWLAPLAALVSWPLVRAARTSNAEQYALSAELAETTRRRRYLEQLLTGRREAAEIRAFQLATPLLDRWNHAYTGEYTRRLHLQHRTAWRRFRATLTSQAILAALLAALAAAVHTRLLTLASAGTALAALLMLETRFRTTTLTLATTGSSLQFIQDLRQFLHQHHPGHRPGQPATQSTATGTPHSPTADRGCAELRLEHVDFTYPGTPTPALSDICITIPAGHTIALVGPNGSGKSTLAKIIAGLYEPDTGTLSRDGRPVHNPQTLRDGCTVVFQDFLRYWLSAADNIALGRLTTDTIDPDRLRQAAHDAGAHTLIQRLPNGYDTTLAKELTGGTELSAGQWQRIATARAFYRNAPLLILDEPTASLDPEAETRLYHHIQHHRQNHTTILIAHRLAATRNADHIYVLENGRITEHGPPQQLLSTGGRYAAMYHAQATGYQTNTTPTNSTPSNGHPYHGPDELHLPVASGLDEKTANHYANAARALLEQPPESDPATSPRTHESAP
ncbi:hypothetical protein CTZ27_38180 [Streptomyces griseocarneus]|nr:hypothetical protein CTZ27_38180 [Streptomyces griseocarneus]